MTYPLLKALHIAATVIWVGGMLAVALGPSDRARRWDRLVTTPAMLVTLGCGVALAMTGGWFPARWLVVKLGFVLLLTALHGVLAGRLRRGLAPPRLAAPLIVAGVVAVVGLAAIKP